MITRRNLLKCSPAVLLGEKPKEGITINGVGLVGFIDEDNQPNYRTDGNCFSEFSQKDFCTAIHEIWGDNFEHKFTYFIHKDGIDIRIKENVTDGKETNRPG